MDDYIKREDVSRLICRRLPPEPFMKRNWDKWFKENEDLVLLKDEVCNLPPADVVSVRHGWWVEYGENKDGTHNIRCPVCDAGFKSKGHANSYYTKHKYRYCPNCGAKMDGEEGNG